MKIGASLGWVVRWVEGMVRGKWVNVWCCVVTLVCVFCSFGEGV